MDGFLTPDRLFRTSIGLRFVSIGSRQIIARRNLTRMSQQIDLLLETMGGLTHQLPFSLNMKPYMAV